MLILLRHLMVYSGAIFAFFLAKNNADVSKFLPYEPPFENPWGALESLQEKESGELSPTPIPTRLPQHSKVGYSR